MLLNSVQAKKIFDKHSFLYGTQDVVDAVRMMDFFGEDAIIHVIYNHPEDREPAAGIKLWEGHYRIVMTYDGLQQVITYCNKQELINREKALLAKVPEVDDEEWLEVKENSKIIEFNKRRKQA